MNLYEKLLAVQLELKAPKSQYNSFGKYNFRSCEDILEAVKPLCAKYKALTLLDDEVVLIGGRFYVKATAMFIDTEKPDSRHEVHAYAREEEAKKGMDGSQVTGSSSSYARKYALNGLFDIDDTKDADTDEQANQSKRKPAAKPATVKKAESAANKIECPICHNILTGYISKSGKEVTPEQEFEKLGMCKDCYRAEREINKQ